jgi:hypothetical protein
MKTELLTRKEKLMDDNNKDEGKNKRTGARLEKPFYHINGDFTQDVLPNLTFFKLSFGTCLLHHNQCN